MNQPLRGLWRPVAVYASIAPLAPCDVHESSQLNKTRVPATYYFLYGVVLLDKLTEVKGSKLLGPDRECELSSLGSISKINRGPALYHVLHSD
jgi:hypothetical protein